MSTSLKRAQLFLLRKLGRKYLKSKSNFGIEYIISLGDFFSQDPFYNPTTNSGEIITSVAWCINKSNPIIFDIGAHCGYMSTHFAKLLELNKPDIFSFEPVTPTYWDLTNIMQKLALDKIVTSIPAAISDRHEIVSLNYSKWASMFAQVNIKQQTTSRSGDDTWFALSTTIDDVISQFNKKPDLIKLDVEGFECFVLRGATKLLQSEKKPAFCIEWNPEALTQCCSSGSELAALFDGYDFYYINDYGDKSLDFLNLIENVSSLSWVCNLFAIPRNSNEVDSWKANIKLLQKRYSITL